MLLRLELLGDFCVKYGDQPITSIVSARLQSLIAYLVLHRETPQLRQHLAFLLYPDSSESQARTNLRNLIHLLRHAVPEPDSFLAHDTLTLQWRADSGFALDVVEFEAHAALGLERAAKGESDGAIEHLQAAVELYRGDLLPSCYDDWILPVRERLSQKYIELLERLIEQLIEQHNPRAALVHAQKLMRCDPLREETFRTLMQIAAATGDRAGVVRYYNTCTTVLERELGVSPSHETRALFDQLSNEPAAATRAVQTRAPSPRRNHLPLYLDRFVGRECEKVELKKLISQHRLVTLVGAGGVGKTRLSVATASDLLDDVRDGIWQIDLAPLADPALVTQTVATVMDVREQSGRPLIQTLADALNGKELLLILDNCEHVIHAARSFIEYLLRAAPDVSFLATSRQILGITGERVFRVPPLRVPDPIPWSSYKDGEDRAAALELSESAALFVERAMAALPTFVLSSANANAVAKICRRLDGIPLALELAAARVKLLNPDQIATGLDHACALLTRGGSNTVTHHKTLRATMDWSYETLSPHEQTLLRQLSVFAGGFSVEAVEAVCADEEHGDGRDSFSTLDILSDLVDKSLVALESNGGGTRPYLLEIVRQYAREKLLEAGEAQSVSARHLEYFTTLAETGEAKLCGSEQRSWLKNLEIEHDNLRAALEWSRLVPDAGEGGLKLAAALWHFWEMKGYLTEGSRWLESRLDNATDSPRLRAKALGGFATLIWLQGDYPRAEKHLNVALALYRQLGEKQGIALALNDLACQAGIMGQVDRAEALLIESLETAQLAQDKRLISLALSNLGEVARCRGDLHTAAQRYAESKTLSDEVGDEYNSCNALFLLAQAARQLGRHDEASALYKQCLEFAREIESNLFLSESFEGLAVVAVARRNWREAVRLMGAAAALREAKGIIATLADGSELEIRKAELRVELGEAMFRAAWAEGKALSLEQTIECAMEICR